MGGWILFYISLMFRLEVSEIKNLMGRSGQNSLCISSILDEE